MKTIKWPILAITALTVVTACDPYDDPNDADPAVVMVTSTSGAGDSTEGTASGTAWTVTSASACSLAGGGAFADQPIFFVTFNKQMDPATIQTSPDDCTPAGGWLTVTPPPPAGMQWFSCYTPSSPTTAEGGSAIIFLAEAEPEDVATCSEATPPAGGWDVAEAIDAAATTFTSYRIEGTVRDAGGRDLPIDVTVNVDPDPAEEARNLTVSASTADSVTLSWINRVCADETDPSVKYVLRRADAEGAFTIDVAEFPITTTTFTVPGLTAAQAASFELFTVTTPPGAAEPLEAPKGAIENVVPGLTAPPAPTLAFEDGGTFGVVTVAIAAGAPGATSHDVYRKTSPTGAYSLLTGSAMGTDVLTSRDPTVAGNTRYIYKVVPLAAATDAAGEEVDGRGVDSAETVFVTKPEEPDAPEVLGTTDTTATVAWTIPGNVTTDAPGNLTWVIERAPDANGAAGTFAPVATTATFDPDERLLTLEDTGLTPSTTYHYRVTLANAGGTSPAGADAPAETMELPSPAVTIAGATLSWTAVPGAATYTVSRSLSNACGFEAIQEGVTGTTFTDPAPTAGAFYTVTAVSATGASAPSTAVP